MRKGGLDGLPLQLKKSSSETATCNIPIELVIVSLVSTVHVLRKKGQIETMSFFTRLYSSLVPWLSLN